LNTPMKVQVPLVGCFEYSNKQIIKTFCTIHLFIFVRSPTCFGQLYPPYTGSHMQQYFNLELSHVVTTVVFTIIKLLK